MTSLTRTLLDTRKWILDPLVNERETKYNL